jgi:predicted nucleic acid-binding protein
MSDDFVDTNIIVYMFDREDIAKRDLARSLIFEGMESRNLSISFQVVQEVLNVVTRKLDVPLTSDEASTLLRDVLSELWHIMPSKELYERALILKERYELRFFDAVMVASALEGGCTRLISEDLQHGQVIQGLRIENPFAGLS